ncbi:MAG: YeeE/YedE thiosulfate transporter family protein [Prolixibacteraceae bacterium]|nr:YeeE/YedE thiosulfate transporter family protein [Prolixibacteraceae bacterium]MDD4754554.1 YeeE/YedE thiosulfate transporter family protein [Prolixibacteraceae bacterium]NLO03328.1 YeeE/YedE family protein [Bacteroidales bacterium]
MGPLAPYVISEEFSLVIAFFLGIGFGFVLEQAGFSSTRKLVGLFYGYDFTVLRVFFTAGITAMAGVLLMDHYGLLNKEVIYVNPAFINSALVGGAIMGAGFIIGGFCPGTSICALAIGKLDALAFVVGSIIGVWGFIEFFPALENLYLAGNLGQIRLSEYLEMADITFAFLLAAIAVFSFIVTWIIENRVNKRASLLGIQLRKRYIAAVILLFAVLTTVAFIPGRNDIIKMRIAEARRQQTCVFKEIPADKLANEIVNNYYKFNIIDVRPEQEFEKYHLPMAINIPFGKMMELQYQSVFRQRLKTNVFYADSDTLVRMACLKAKYIGRSDNYILKESVGEFREMFFEAEPPPPNALKSQIDLYNFRTVTAQKMEYLVNSLKNIGAPVKMEPVTVKGGC